MSKIIANNIYKIFGPDPLSVMHLLQQGIGKDEVLETTGHTVGLDNVSISIEEGEIFVVMGLSGSGKSALIRHVNRLIDPTAGEIIVDSQNIIDLDKKDLINFRRDKMSMVFQKFGLLPHKNIIDNVAYGLEIQKKPKQERHSAAMRQIESVGLNGFEYMYPNQLSGGMQQRVGLARALTTNPDILLMDEAFSALDPLIRKDMQDILLELQSELKKTVVFITHDLDEALKIGDRIAILKDGYMDQEGDAVDILLSPKTDYVKKFVEDVNRSRVLKAKNIMQNISEISKDLLNGQSLKVKADDVIEKFIDRVVTDKPNLVEVLGADGSAVGYLSPTRLAEILRK